MVVLRNIHNPSMMLWVTNRAWRALSCNNFHTLLAWLDQRVDLVWVTDDPEDGVWHMACPPDSRGDVCFVASGEQSWIYE